MRLMTDASGAVTDPWRYDAYGNVKSHTGSSTTKLSFARQWGYQQDSGGIQLLGHRYYESDTGVFLSRDPALDGSNWFGYVDGNPTNAIDPDNLQLQFTGTLSDPPGRVKDGPRTTHEPSPNIGPGAPKPVTPSLPPITTPLLVLGLSLWPNNQGVSSDYDMDWRKDLHPKNGKGGNDKGRGDDPMWDLSNAELWAILESKSESPARKALARKILKYRKQYNKKKRGG